MIRMRNLLHRSRQAVPAWGPVLLLLLAAVPARAQLQWNIPYNDVAQPNGSGFRNQTPGTPDLYAGFDKFLQRGNLTGTNLFDTSTASFVGQPGNPSPDFTNDNLFFNGPLATAANGGNNVKLFAPAAYRSGSSVSHIDKPISDPTVMKPTI